MGVSIDEIQNINLTHPPRLLVHFSLDLGSNLRSLPRRFFPALSLTEQLQKLKPRSKNIGHGYTMFTLGIP
jgi:hypothetical protein